LSQIDSEKNRPIPQQVTPSRIHRIRSWLCKIVNSSHKDPPIPCSASTYTFSKYFPTISRVLKSKPNRLIFISVCAKVISKIANMKSTTVINFIRNWFFCKKIILFIGVNEVLKVEYEQFYQLK